VVYLCYHLKIELMTKRKEVSKSTVMAIVSRINAKNKPLSERYPRLKALISNPGASATIARVVRKVSVNKEVHQTSIDAEAAKLRAILENQEIPDNQGGLTSIDAEAAKLRAIVDDPKTNQISL
jgi:hypothetical protein